MVYWSRFDETLYDATRSRRVRHGAISKNTTRSPPTEDSGTLECVWSFVADYHYIVRGEFSRKAADMIPDRRKVHARKIALPAKTTFLIDPERPQR
jgi:hypothetical protein